MRLYFPTHGRAITSLSESGTSNFGKEYALVGHRYKKNNHHIHNGTVDVLKPAGFISWEHVLQMICNNFIFLFKIRPVSICYHDIVGFIAHALLNNGVFLFSHLHLIMGKNCPTLNCLVSYSLVIAYMLHKTSYCISVFIGNARSEPVLIILANKKHWELSTSLTKKLENPSNPLLLSERQSF